MEAAMMPVSDEDEEFDVEGMGIEEGMVEEVMKRLEAEISGRGSPLRHHSSSFITINGNEESCGPSFSDSSSTVMASIDMGGVGIWNLLGPACSNLFEGTWEMGAQSTDQELSPPVGASPVAFGAEENEEEWLDRVLSMPAFEVEIELGF